MSDSGRSGCKPIGVVLAGGRSSRMGRDKVDLVYRGRSLLEHMVRLMHAAGIDRVVVSGERPGFDSVPDRAIDQGPLAGISAVAERFPGSVLLVVPIDMPLLTTGRVLQLLDAAPATAVHFDGHTLPLRIASTTDLRTLLRRWLNDASAPRALHKLCKEIGAEQLPVEAEAQAEFANANSPVEWEAIRR